MIIKKFIKKNLTLSILILILAFSFLIRIYDLQNENLWPDEAVTIYNAHKPVSHNIQWSLSLGYFPLYHIILSIWEKFFGLREFSVRFLSVIFGVFSVYMAYRIGGLMFNKRVGLYSAIIIALSPFNVYYSQEARIYTMFVLLTLLSVYFYVKYIKSIKNKDLIYYIIFTLLMLNSFGSAIFILIFQNMHYFLFVRKNLKKWIITQFAVFILFLPLALIVIKSMLELSQYLVVSKPDLITLIRTFYIFSAGTTYKLESLIFGGILSILFSLLILLIIINIYKDIKNKDYSKISNVAFLLLWLAIPIFLLILQSYMFYSLYFERYILASSIALYMLVALSISKLKYKAQLFAVLAIILVSSAILYIDFTTLDKGDWKDTADYININKHEKDFVIVHVPRSIYSLAYYSYQECFKSDNLTKCMSEKNIYGVKNADELPVEATRSNKVFLLLFNEKYIDREGTLLKYFSSNYNLIEKKEYAHIQIFTFEKPNI